jgi:16S rRNA (cytosine1402-N4)-methyltransferase
MEEPPAERPKRRVRYTGRNPRHFSQKYKELGHDPETLAKVVASGKTPAGTHVPIMVDEILQALRIQPGHIGIDATLGFGGHAAEMLKRVGENGRLIGLDLDPLEQPKTIARLADLGFTAPRFVAVHSNYAGIRKVLDAEGLAAVDFVLADLGCSSMQIDNPERGFTWKTDGPLDMRMNPDRGVSARQWLEKINEEKLAKALHENADEPLAEEIARDLAGKSLVGSRDLVTALEAIPAVARLNLERRELCIRRVFQAIRIAVNEEFSALDAFLRHLPYCVKPGGRVAILTFHSGEDRRVKKSLQAGLRDGLWKELSDGVIIASPEERHRNPRSAPAKLRWAIRS